MKMVDYLELKDYWCTTLFFETYYDIPVVMRSDTEVPHWEKVVDRVKYIGQREPDKYAVSIWATGFKYRSAKTADRSNIVMSNTVAEKLRAKEMTAFVLVTAADLIWEEALEMDEK